MGKLKHGFSKTREYSIWSKMKARCDPNSNDIKYLRYREKKIKVCNRWLKFENFYRDMGKSPSLNHSLDRIDNKGNYELSNCRWTTKDKQVRNMDKNIWLTYKGENKILKDWASHFNMSSQALRTRIRNGWDLEKAFTTPIKKYMVDRSNAQILTSLRLKSGKAKNCENQSCNKVSQNYKWTIINDRFFQLCNSCLTYLYKGDPISQDLKNKLLLKNGKNQNAVNMISQLKVQGGK